MNRGQMESIARVTRGDLVVDRWDNRRARASKPRIHSQGRELLFFGFSILNRPQVAVALSYFYERRSMSSGLLMRFSSFMLRTIAVAGIAHWIFLCRLI